MWDGRTDGEFTNKGMERHVINASRSSWASYLLHQLQHGLRTVLWYCLYMTYGEDVLEAIKTNIGFVQFVEEYCSLWGWPPTSTLYRKIANLGFKSVVHYLSQTRRTQITTRKKKTQLGKKKFLQRGHCPFFGFFMNWAYSCLREPQNGPTPCEKNSGIFAKRVEFKERSTKCC